MLFGSKMRVKIKSDRIAFRSYSYLCLALIFLHTFIEICVKLSRKKLPKAPRTFKVPFGPVIPVVGIVGTIYMILNISTDPAEAVKIWLLTGGTFLILAIYSFFWIKYRMRMPVFKSVPLQEVMAMDNELYYVVRKQSGIWK